MCSRDIETLIRGTGRAYELTQSHGRAQVLGFADDHVVMSYAGIYQFLPCLEVGVMEEAVISCGYNVAIALKLSSPSAGDVLVRYAKPT